MPLPRIFGGGGEKAGVSPPPPPDSPLKVSYHGSGEAVGVPPDLAKRAKSLLNYDTGVPSHKAPVKIETTYDMARPAGTLLHDESLYNKPSHTVNAQLEKRGHAQIEIKVNESYSDPIGIVKASVTPTHAVITIENDAEASKRVTDAVVLTDPKNIEAAERGLREITRKVVPIVESWVKQQGGLDTSEIYKSFQSGLTPSGLYDESGEVVKKFIQVGFKTGVREQVEKWFATATEQEKGCAKATLAALYNHVPSGEKLLEDPFAYCDITSLYARFFPASAAEIQMEKEALRVAADLDRGKLKETIQQFLRDKKIKTNRAARKDYPERLDLTYELPAELNNMVRVEDDGSIVVDLQTVGLDKIGFTAGIVETIVEQLDSLTNARLRCDTKANFGGKSAKELPPSHPLLKPHIGILEGGKADLKRYPTSVQEDVSADIKTDFSMMELLGPTNTGKTFLTSEMFRELADRSYGHGYGFSHHSAPADDVVAFEFTGPTEDQVREASGKGTDALNELSRVTYQNWVSALEDMKGIIATRQGKATFLYWDNFHLIPYTDDPIVRTRLLNLADEFRRELGQTNQSLPREKRTVFAIHLMGEKRPDRMDKSFIESHRFKEEVVSPGMKDLLGIMSQTANARVDGSVESQARELVKALRSQRTRDEEPEVTRAREQSIREIEARTKGLPNILINAFNDSLLSNQLFSILSSDPAYVKYLGGGNREKIFDRYATIFHDEIETYLQTGESAWLVMGKGGKLKLSEEGEKILAERLSRVIGEVVFDALDTAHAKSEGAKPTDNQLAAYRNILEGIKTKVPADKPAEKETSRRKGGKKTVVEISPSPPEFKTTTPLPQPEITVKTGNLLDDVARESQATQEEIARLQALQQRAEQLTTLKQAISDYGQEGVQFIASSDLFAVLSNPDIGNRLQQQDATAISDGLRRGIIGNTDTIYGILEKIAAKNNIQLNLPELRDDLIGLEALFNDESTWKDPARAKALLKLATSPLQRVLDAASKSNLSTESTRIKTAYAAFEQK
jgi:hypothetical protein